MTGAAAVAADLGMVILAGISSGNRPGNQIHTGILSLQRHIEITDRRILPVRHQPFMDDQTGSGSQLCRRLAEGTVHAADLDRIHLQHRIFSQLDIRHRIDPAKSASRPRTDMFFLIQHMGSPIQEKPVDSVVFGHTVIVCMHAAACHHRHIGAGAHVKIIVHQIIHAAVGDAGRDIDLLLLRFGTDPDDQTRSVLF